MKVRSLILLLAILIVGTGKGFAQMNANLVPGKLFMHGSMSSEFSSDNNSSQASSDDSVYFDLSVAYQVTSIVDIPIYFRSSGTVNSFDFAIQYNHQKATFDSILVQLSNLQYMYYYNPQDSTLRFTSNSLDPFPQDSAVVIIRLQVFSGPICSGDLYNSETWLNGELCSNQIINCVISDLEETPPENQMHLYPNPASDYLLLNTNVETQIQITDLSGKFVLDAGNILAYETNSIDISILRNGIYFVQFRNNHSILVRKLIINR